MTDLKQVNFNTIEPIISQDAFKIFEDEMMVILDSISEKYKIEMDDLVMKVLQKSLESSISNSDMLLDEEEEEDEIEEEEEEED